MADFGKAYEKTLAFEGEYAFDPDDPGGETYRGIARRFNPGWEGWKTIDRTKRMAGFPENLESIGPLQTAVRKFYKQHYWDRFQGDMIASQEIANELFDASVNLGVTRAVTFLQTGLNVLNRDQSLYPDVVEDGLCGPRTLEALTRYLQHDSVEYLLKVANILQGMHYIAIMKKSPTQEKYARGWLDRIDIGPHPRA